jgi:hypothetical protein
MSFPRPRPGRLRLAGPGAVRPGTGQGEAYHRLGSLTLTKVRAVHTRGGLELVEHRVPPGYAPPEAAPLLTPVGPTSSRRTR